MAKTGDPSGWMKELARNGMEDDPEAAGYLYADAHIRVYHGDQAKLPRRDVSRERLCLRGTRDYWINDRLGRPFFVVSKAVTRGLADTLLQDIVPELLALVPGQPSEADLAADPNLPRFVMVFDREGATKSLLGQLWRQRIAAITYRKNVKDLWSESDFLEQEVPVVTGGSPRMRLARRETELGTGKDRVPVIEIRRLTASGHQTAIITTGRTFGSLTVASHMFARWYQENYFAYMMQYDDMDGLIEYGAESIPGTTEVVNPS